MGRERREAIAKALFIAGMTVISAVAAVVLLVYLMGQGRRRLSARRAPDG